MSHTLDFDRLMAELQADDKPEAEPLKMKVLGEEYILPFTIPAIVVLANFRQEGRNRAEIFAAGDVIFGREALDKWARAGWDIDRICEAVLLAERLILGESPQDIMDSLLPDPEGDNQGEKKGPSADASIPSPKSTSSKQRSKKHTK